MLRANKAASTSDSAGFRRMFSPGRLSLGVFFPIEAFERDEPSMRDQPQLARRAEELGFAGLWTRDVPLRDPSFGDLGQIHDPWVWLGCIAAHTSTIALATGSIILPLRHPLHTAKASASVDQLTGGRFVLGVASGDRPVEFPAFGVNWLERDSLFRENLSTIRKVLMEEFPTVQSSYGALTGTADVVPKPVSRLPILITGSSRQSFEWIAEHADGWITYPRGLAQQAELVAKWRAAVEVKSPGMFKPFAQSLYIDLADGPAEPPRAIHLGFRAGRNFMIDFLNELAGAGVNHVILNLKYGRRDAGEVLEEIGKEVLPRLGEGRGTPPRESETAR